MTPRTMLIVNPRSGSRDALEQIALVHTRLQPHLGAIEIVTTGAAGDATSAARRAAAGPYDTVLIAGGDGTLNEVLNGVAGVAGGLARLTLGVVPLGTGNDFARALGLPEDLPGALEVIVAGRRVAVDVGMLNEHHFVNVSAGGFFAQVSSAVDGDLKSAVGPLAYLLGGASALIEHEPSPVHLVARRGGQVVERDLTMKLFAVCNARMAGGGRLIAPRALLDDGLLDVCLIEDLPTLEFLALLARFGSGEHVDDERVGYFQAESLDLSFPEPLAVNTDGELLETRECRYRVLPRAATFLASTGALASGV
ncbi:MAG: diacylglycerol kinase family lipid kinase [Myxococcales bacterium]|nr:MAG: diacylglycerol kinase family lipid kinase [Myxococcales bacterium]